VLSRAEYVTESARWLVRSLLADPADMPAIAAAAARHADIDDTVPTDPGPTAGALPLVGS
jgi:hypothetical protein